MRVVEVVDRNTYSCKKSYKCLREVSVKNLVFRVPKGHVASSFIFAPSYCLAVSSDRLTVMNQVVTVQAAHIAKNDPSCLGIILTTAYDTWRHELDLRTRVIAEHTETPIIALGPVTSTIDEVRLVSRVLIERNASSCTLVAERHHMVRLYNIMRAFVPESVALTTCSVRCPKFERAREPSTIKSIRIGNELLWALWNYGQLAQYEILPRMKRATLG